MTLLRSLGGVAGVHGLQNQPIIDLLYRLAERSGMAWWKKRWSQAHQILLKAGTDPTVLEKAAKVLKKDEPAVAPPGEGRDLLFEEFRKVVGNKRAAEHWVSWAEQRHLLVRGTNVTCIDCGVTSWLPMASLPPPVGCPSCGRKIKRPYGSCDLKFSYRIAEPLRRTFETDSLGHVLALRWLAILFDGHGLVGAYPGVTFIDAATGSTVGEGDVCLLFSDGSIVPVEVKRRQGGTRGQTIELMDKLANALEAPYDILAVTEPARECESIRQYFRRLPERPRLLLTNDQLHEPAPVWLLGRNPFEFNPRTEEQDNDRHARFAHRFSDDNSDVPFDAIRAALLD
jgi:hypothetical protein